MTEVSCPQSYSGSVRLRAHHDRHVTSFSAQGFVQVHQARVAHGVERALRHAKRYHVSDSPLTAITWWRLMLDEAQNVGDGFSQAHLAQPLTKMYLGFDYNARLWAALHARRMHFDPFQLNIMYKITILKKRLLQKRPIC